jgi:hypothetical protein
MDSGRVGDLAVTSAALTPRYAGELVPVLSPAGHNSEVADSGSLGSSQDRQGSHPSGGRCLLNREAGSGGRRPARTGPESGASPDPKPAKRVVASADVWALMRPVILREPCYGCLGLSPLRRGVHHLVPKSLGGDDVIENLIPLCGTGTTGCHGIYEDRAPGWRMIAGMIRKALSVEKVGYVVGKKGEDFLDRYYPRAD